MRACVYDHFGSEEVLQISNDIVVPEPHSDEVQLQIKAAGVNPVDWKIREGYFKDRDMKHDFPIIPGWDGSGIVTKVGANVIDLKVGDEVFGYFRSPRIKWGTYAQYSVVKETSLAIKPKEMSFQVAAALSLTALTAWQALFEFANLQGKQTILIHGASGGVGGMAVQFAKNKGAYIIATCSEKNHEYVRSLGADVCIDYTKASVASQLKKLKPEGVDVVMDCVGSSEALSKVIKKKGVLVSIVDWTVENFSSADLKAGFIFVYPNGDELAKIALMYKQGVLKAPFITEMPLSEAKSAQMLVKTGHVRGKIVLIV